jgi:hypothetical protein
MKKLSYIILILSICSTSVYAQFAPIKQGPAVPFTPTQWVRIFERPNYQGRFILFAANTANPVIPFPLNNISVSISSNTKVYLTTGCSEFPSEWALVENNADLRIPEGVICGIRLAKAVPITIKFDGILAEIHNNDCRKMYGNIQYNVFEVNARGEWIRCPSGNVSMPYTVTVFQNEKGNNVIKRYVYNINEFYVADRDYVASRLSGYKPSISSMIAAASQNFIVDDTALNNNRVKIEVKIKLGSAHKGCDACTDHTWDAAMTTTQTFLIDVKRPDERNRFASFETVQAGPYRKDTSTGRVRFEGGGGFSDGPVSASGGPGFTGREHATYVQFSIRRNLWLSGSMHF